MAQLGAEPTSQHFREIVMNLSSEERTDFMKDLFGLAFSDWRHLTVPYRKFLIGLIKGERQLFIEFVRKDTVLGEFLYDLKDEEMFIRILNLLELPCKKHKTFYTGLAFFFLLGFNIDLRVKSLSDKIRFAKADTDDLYELFEKITLD